MQVCYPFSGRYNHAQDRHINFLSFITFSLPMSACQNTGLLSSVLKSESCRNISVKLCLETTSLFSKSEPFIPSKILFFFFLWNQFFFSSVWDPVAAATTFISGTKCNVYITKMNWKPYSKKTNKQVTNRFNNKSQMKGIMKVFRLSSVWWFLLCMTVPCQLSVNIHRLYSGDKLMVITANCSKKKRKKRNDTRLWLWCNCDSSSCLN